jgi:hypothetical protein
LTAQRFPIDRIRRLRYALGTALLLAGGLALWIAPDRSFMEVPVGWLLLFAATLLLSYRNYVEVDPNAGRLAHRLGFGFAFPWKTFDASGVESIELKSVERHSGDDGEASTVYTVAVKGAAGAAPVQK